MFCERCGTKLDPAAAGLAEFCAACSTFVGEECWDAVGACRSCAESGRAPRAVGLVAVRRARRQLRIARGEVDALEAVARVSAEPPQLTLETWFARRRVDLIRDASRRAALATAPRYATRLVPLEREIAAEHAGLLLRLDALEGRTAAGGVVPRGAIPRPRAAAPAPAPFAWRSRLSDLRLPLALGLLLAAALLAPRLAALVAGPAGSTVSRSVSAASPEAGVAAARGTPAQASAPARSAEVPDAASFTFDAMRMGETLAGDLSIARGSTEQVQVAPRPSAVDRSLRLSSDAEGAGAEVCLAPPFPVGGAEMQVLTADDRAELFMTLGQRSAPVVRFVVGGGRADLNGATAPVRIDAGQWFRLAIHRDPIGTMTSASIEQVRGTGHATSLSASSETGDAADGTGLCIGLSDGEAGIEAFINDLEVRP
jgi:hypothetical protein